MMLLWPLVVLSLCLRDLCAFLLFPARARLPLCATAALLPPRSLPCMRGFSPQYKHRILGHYRAGVRGAGFQALADRFAVKGGASVVRRWHARWNGTPASLIEQHRSGRPRILSRAEVSRHVRAPLLAANRAHRAIHYTTLLPAVKQKTGKQISIQSLRRIGKEQLGAKQKRCKKRTSDESACTAIHGIGQTRLSAEHGS